MRRSCFVLVLALLAITAFSPRPADAQTCTECVTLVGGDWDYLEEHLDYNGGGFSTYDLGVVEKIRIYGGNDIITPAILQGYTDNQVDVSGDGQFTVNDGWRLLKMKSYMADAGLSSLDLVDFYDCAHRYILNICPR